MPKVNRIVGEYLRQRVYPTVDAEAVDQGDLLVRNVAGTVSKASIMATADAVADVFAGLAAQSKLAGEVKSVVVAVDVIADMDLPSALTGSAGLVGDKVEINVVAGAAVNQRVIINTGSTDVIGKLAKPCPLGATVARVHLVGVDVRIPPVAD